MAKITIYNQAGETVRELEASAAIFDISFNKDLVHQALVRQLANRRLGMISHTKTKGEVVGGKKKPFRQKGTGGARQGATNNPHQKGGGVSFGPRNVRNFKKDMPKKQRRLALFSAISQKLRDEQVIGLDKYENAEIKTKQLADVLSKIPTGKDLLLVLPEKNNIIAKSARNLPNVKTILVNYLNIADLQKYETVVFLEDSIEKMETIFLAAK